MMLKSEAITPQLQSLYGFKHKSKLELQPLACYLHH